MISMCPMKNIMKIEDQYLGLNSNPLEYIDELEINLNQNN